MAKRRVLRAEAKEPEELTPEERREQRKRGRERSPKARARRSGRRFFGAILAGGVAAAIAAVLVALLVFLPAHPCLSFSAPPGPIQFPSAGTTDFNGTWCPQNAPVVYAMRPFVAISIGGTSVSLPNAIGRNSSFSGYECDLPIRTVPVQSGEPSGTIHIDSDWAYAYNLSDFFNVWSRSYSTVFVNASHPNQPVTYSPNDLLGFTADANHAVQLYVDGALTTAGPSLELTTLDWEANPYPSCLGSQYGTGHVISLQYRSISATAASLGDPFPPGSTARPSFAPGSTSLHDVVADLRLLAAAQGTGVGWILPGNRSAAPG